jgi:alpha-ribazole phosphatase
MPLLPHYAGHYTGQTDAAATALTHADAALLATLNTASHWHSSTLQRSIAGAEWLQQHMASSTPLQTHAALCEQNFGAWEGCSYDEIYNNHPHLPWHTPAVIEPPQGESFTAVCARVAAWITTHPTTDCIIVAHAGVIRAALAHALGISAAQALFFSIGHGSLTHIQHWQQGAQVHYVNRPFLS